MKIGISGRKIFEENNLNQDTVWGIARSKKSNFYKPTLHESCNNIDLIQFIQNELAIDILLDASNGKMRMCVVGTLEEGEARGDDNNNEDKEVKIWNMPTAETEGWEYGWVPHFMFGTKSKNTELRMMEILDDWYGIEKYQLCDAIVMESESFV